MSGVGAFPSLLVNPPWGKLASVHSTPPRALQGGLDPVTLPEFVAWTRAYRFPTDVCEYFSPHDETEGLHLDPSAAAVLLYTTTQAIFVYRAFAHARKSTGPSAEYGRALGRGFAAILMWHISHFLAHELKRPWTWFGSHYFFIVGEWQIAAALRSPRAGIHLLLCYLVLDGIITALGGDYLGLCSGVTYGAYVIAGCDSGDDAADSNVRWLIRLFSVCSASMFGLIEVLFCNRLLQSAVLFGSAHTSIELFVLAASITFSRATEGVVRRMGMRAAKQL